MELLIKLNNNLSNRHIHSSNISTNTVETNKAHFSDIRKQELSIQEQPQPQPQHSELAALSEDGNLENLLNVMINILTSDNWLTL